MSRNFCFVILFVFFVSVFVGISYAEETISYEPGGALPPEEKDFYPLDCYEHGYPYGETKGYYRLVTTEIDGTPTTEEGDTLNAARDERCDDGDESKVTWTYCQEKGKPKEFRVRIEIESAS